MYCLNNHIRTRSRHDVYWVRETYFAGRPALNKDNPTKLQVCGFLAGVDALLERHRGRKTPRAVQLQKLDQPPHLRRQSLRDLVQLVPDVVQLSANHLTAGRHQEEMS